MGLESHLYPIRGEIGLISEQRGIGKIFPHIMLGISLCLAGEIALCTA